ncbi:hypothetical protein EV401DRAFT_2062431 [Pisolithus croceorrhizus]|nr:hypothetical protein EV401DRAFT_2062431 [Pisolithus croceorrhizus]
MVCHKPSRFMDDDVVLPVSHSDLRLPSRPYFTKRSARVLLILALVSCALVVFRLGHSTRDDASQYLYLGAMEDNSTENGLPPLYESYHDYERHLPQHNLSLPYPEGRDAKFFWAANHVHSSGWGNSMQELLVNALLSHTVNRAFVFDNYTWDPDGPDYSVYNGKLIPSRIPHSAIISGPIIGSSWPPGDPTPRSVSREYFERVCPHPLVIDSYEINKELRLDTSVPASVIFDEWVDRLNSLRDPCVEIKRSSFQIFEIWLFGSSRILSLWPSIFSSILPTFILTLPQSPQPRLHNVEPILTPNQTNPVPGLLALHVRRGDFAAHLCPSCLNGQQDWNGFNKFVALPDKFRPPPEGGRGHTTEENLQLYMKRCFPTIEQITDKVRKVLEEQYSLYGNSRELKRVYVMTNGDQEWLEELKAALMEVKRWDAVVTSRDLSLGWETKPVAQAVDMLVGQRAQVIIGNGFSSLTSNIVMFRMLRELPPEDTRFW